MGKPDIERQLYGYCANFAIGHMVSLETLSDALHAEYDSIADGAVRAVGYGDSAAPPATADDAMCEAVERMRMLAERISSVDAELDRWSNAIYGACGAISDRRVYDIAVSHYVQRMPKQAIAEEHGISPRHINRILERARAQIWLNLPRDFQDEVWLYTR